jgi:hypothetical protein
MYLGSPLSIRCASIDEVGQFLLGCTFVSDKEQFGVGDYWMRPADFERTRRGDCDDFALWTWRQMLILGYQARFVFGLAGARRRGHAWVTFESPAGHMLLESTAASFRKLPSLTVSTYEPKVSVALADGRLVFREHRERSYSPTLIESLGLAAEYLPRALANQAVSFVTFPWYFLKRTLGGRNA